MEKNIFEYYSTIFAVVFVILGAFIYCISRQIHETTKFKAFFKNVEDGNEYEFSERETKRLSIEFE